MTNDIMREFTIHPKAGAMHYRNEGYDLASVYECWSFKKDKAWQYCRWLCDQVNGTGLAIRSHNTFTFTANFYFYHPDNGREMLAIITPSYNHAYYLD